MLINPAGLHLAELQFDQQQDGSHSSRRISGGHHRLLPKSVLCLCVTLPRCLIVVCQPLFTSSVVAYPVVDHHTVCVMATFYLVCLCPLIAVNSVVISVLLLRLSLQFFCRAHRLNIQQQLLWQFGVQRRGHPSSPRWAVLSGQSST